MNLMQNDDQAVAMTSSHFTMANRGGPYCRPDVAPMARGTKKDTAISQSSDSFEMTWVALCVSWSLPCLLALLCCLALPAKIIAHPSDSSPAAMVEYPAGSIESANGEIEIAELLEQYSAPDDELPIGVRLAARLHDLGLSPDAVVVIISMLPVAELRGAIPVGINLFQRPWLRTLVLAIIGNMLPVFLLLLLFDRAVLLLGRIPLFKRFFDWLFARTRRRSELIQRWEFWGLAMFVSVPLPVTGAWTASIASVIMGLRYWRSVLSIFVGVVVAGLIVTSLSLLGRWGALIAGVALLVLFLNGLLSGIRRRRTDSRKND